MNQDTAKRGTPLMAMTEAVWRRIWKRKWLALLALILFVGLAPYLFSRAVSPSRRITIVTNDRADRGEFDGKHIRLLTFNIAHGRGATDSNLTEAASEKPKRIGQIAEFIRSANADIDVLNEVDFAATWSGNQDQAAAIANKADYRFCVEQRNLDFRLLYGSWKFGNVILSRFPIIDARLVSLPALNWWECWICGTKQACICTIEFDKNMRVQILAVHIDFRDEGIRVESAKVFNKLQTTQIFR